MKHVALSPSDWEEIFASVIYKRDHSAAVTDDAEWKLQLTKILKRIGPDGSEAARRGVKSCRHDDWTVVLLLPDTHTDNYGQDTEAVYVTGRSILNAVRNARRKIMFKLNDPDLKEDDLFVISVFMGRHEDRVGQWNTSYRQDQEGWMEKMQNMRSKK